MKRKKRGDEMVKLMHKRLFVYSIPDRACCELASRVVR